MVGSVKLQLKEIEIQDAKLALCFLLMKLQKELNISKRNLQRALRIERISI